MSFQEAVPFPPETMRWVRDRFAYVERDPYGTPRLFFENSGGSLRLRQVTERAQEISLYPESSARPGKVARELGAVVERGTADLMAFFGGEPGGALLPTATASQGMFGVVRAITENVPGTNVVTTAIEHPSSYDACARYAARSGQELRIAPASTSTGGIEPEMVADLVDSGTSLVSVMATSNITGAVVDVGAVVRAVRARNPGVFVVTDGVQYAPHGVLDAAGWQVDAVNIAPYKMFGERGNAFTYLSERVARLDHDAFAGAAAGTWKLGSAAPAWFAGFSAIVDYLVALGGAPAGASRRAGIVAGMDALRRHEGALLRAMTDGLRDVPGVNVHFADLDDDTERDLIVPLSFDGMDVSAAVSAYEDRGVVVYDRAMDSPMSARILRAVGLDSIVRVSPLHCHTLAEVERFLEVTHEVTRGRG